MRHAEKRVAQARKAVGNKELEQAAKTTLLQQARVALDKAQVDLRESKNELERREVELAETLAAGQGGQGADGATARPVAIARQALASYAKQFEQVLDGDEEATKAVALFTQRMQEKHGDLPRAGDADMGDAAPTDFGEPQLRAIFEIFQRKE